MTNYVWSPSNNSFYPVSLRSDYEIAGSWPDDALEISNELYEEFKVSPNNGRQRYCGPDGLPCWTDVPPPSQDELVAQADTTKSTLQREAEDAIKPLERAKSLGIATPQELTLLTEWEKYSVYLMRVDTSTAPNITWPVKPAAV